MDIGNPSIEENSFHNVINVCKLLECLLIFSLLISLHIYIKVFLVKKFCHSNLRILLISQPIIQTFSLSTRIVRHGLDGIDWFDRSKIEILDNGIDTVIFVCGQLMMFIAVERIFGFFKRNYEENSSVILGILLLILMTIIGVLYNYTLCYGLINDYLLFGIGTILSVTSLIIFGIFPIMCNRKLEKVSHSPYSTVSERFQLFRISTVSHLLLFLSPYKSLTTFLTITLHILVYKYSNNELFPLFEVLYFYFNILQLFLQMFLTVMIDETLRMNLYRYIIGINGREVKDITQVRSISGKRMIFTAKEESKLYFDSIQSSWDTKIVVKGQKKIPSNVTVTEVESIQNMGNSRTHTDTPRNKISIGFYKKFTPTVHNQEDGASGTESTVDINQRRKEDTVRSTVGEERRGMYETILEESEEPSGVSESEGSPVVVVEESLTRQTTVTTPEEDTTVVLSRKPSLRRKLLNKWKNSKEK